MNEQQWDQYLQDNLNAKDNQLPRTIHQRIEDTLASLPSQDITTSIITSKITSITKSRTSKFTHRVKIFASAVCIMIIITFSFAYFSPAVAKYLSQLPVIGSAFEWAGDPGIQSFVQNNSVKSIGQSIEDQGITIMLDQVIYDGTRLSVGLLHEEAIRISPNRPGMLKVNGSDVSTSIGVASNEGPDGLMATVYEFTPENPLPGKFNMTLIFDEVHVVQDGQPQIIRGNWTFKTSVRKITEGITVREFDPPLTKSFEGTTISITQLMLTPITIKVAFDLIESEKYGNPHPHNEVMPEFVTSHRLIYELMNEQGLYLEKLSSEGRGLSGEVTKSSALFTPLTSESNSLTFQVVEQSIRMKKVTEDSYVGADTPQVIYTELPQPFPLRIQQGESGDITYNRITFESEQTWVEYEVHGKDPQEQDSAWWIENEKGERFHFDRYDQIRTSNDAYKFRVVLPPMDPNEKLKLAVIQLKAPHILKELEVRIPLD